MPTPQESGGALCWELVSSLPHCPRQLHREQRECEGEAPGSSLRSLWEELKPGFCQSVGPHLVPPHSNVSSPTRLLGVPEKAGRFLCAVSLGSCYCLPRRAPSRFCLQPLIQGCVNHAAVNPRVLPDPGAQ